MSHDDNVETCSSRTRLWRVILTAALIWVSVVVAVTPAVAGEKGTREQRDEVRGQKAAAASQIDAMTAEDAQLRDALGSLEQDVRGQQALVSDAQRGAETAAEEAEAAAEAAAAKKAEVEKTRSRLALMAVDSYMNPPNEGFMDQFHASDAQQAAEKKALFETKVGHVTDVIEQLREAEHQLAEASGRARNLREQAEIRQQEAETQLAELRSSQERQQKLVTEAEARLEAKLAEAAALESYDVELSAKLMAEQEALSVALRAAPVAPVQVVVAPPAPTTSPESGPGSGVTTTTGVGTTTTTPTVSPDPVVPPLASVPLATVGGITVNASIAGKLGQLLDAARADGVILGGGGYRDPSRQIQLRRQNCGTSDYAIYQMSPSACSPPTARPGTSNHERGLAIDFTYNGGSMSTRSNPGYKWLAANAARYGFYNLPSEPWHWSVDGH